MILREETDICLAHGPTRGSALGHPPWARPGCLLWGLLWVCRGGDSTSDSITHFCSCPRFNPLPKASIMQPFKVYSVMRGKVHAAAQDRKAGHTVVDTV